MNTTQPTQPAQPAQPTQPTRANLLLLNRRLRRNLSSVKCRSRQANRENRSLRQEVDQLRLAEEQNRNLRQEVDQLRLAEQQAQLRDADQQRQIQEGQQESQRLADKVRHQHDKVKQYFDDKKEKERRAEEGRVQAQALDHQARTTIPDDCNQRARRLALDLGDHPSEVQNLVGQRGANGLGFTEKTLSNLQEAISRFESLEEDLKQGLWD